MVYAALNSGLGYFDNPKRQMKEWRELGAYLLAQDLVLSASPHWRSRPNTFPVDCWIAEHLRAYDAGDLTLQIAATRFSGSLVARTIELILPVILSTIWIFVDWVAGAQTIRTLGTLEGTSRTVGREFSRNVEV
jgi:hypothetical protein